MAYRLGVFRLGDNHIECLSYCVNVESGGVSVPVVDCYTSNTHGLRLYLVIL